VPPRFCARRARTPIDHQAAHRSGRIGKKSTLSSNAKRGRPLMSNQTSCTQGRGARERRARRCARERVAPAAALVVQRGEKASAPSPAAAATAPSRLRLLVDVLGPMPSPGTDHRNGFVHWASESNGYTYPPYRVRMQARPISSPAVRFTPVGRFRLEGLPTSKTARDSVESLFRPPRCVVGPGGFRMKQQESTR